MKTLRWVYVESGTKIKKILYKVISGRGEVASFDDLNIAYHYELERKQEFINTINDFFDDCNRQFELEFNGKTFEPLVNRVSVADYNKFLKGKLETI